VSVSVGHVPPIFVSHGSLSVALDAEHGAELTHWAGRLPRPRAILAVSSQWQAEVLTRGSTELAHPSYAAPRASDLAYELHSLLPVERDGDRGWDHGVSRPLLRMYPAGGIPVLQLSLVKGATPRTLFAIGRKIGVLAARGVLLLGSGGITSPRSQGDPNRSAPPAPWAREFDAWVANILADAEIEDLLQWRTKGPSARLAHPTPEHLDPLFVVAGAASLYEHAIGFPVRGFDHGTVSRRCIQFGR
jgi:4,5-DOPA dioxygenase extradiol